MDGIDTSAPRRLIALSAAEPSGGVVSKSNIELLSSFNWIESRDGVPAIAVPGHPPKWTPKLSSIRLPSDKERFLQLEPVPRHPHAFEPLLKSLSICRSDFDLSQVNIVTQLRNLREIFRFVRGRGQDAFRINVQLLGTTLFLDRFGNDIEIANGTQSYDSCGHVFQEHATSYCANLNEMHANSYHRVVKYDFLGLHIVVQHEVDTYCCSCHTSHSQDEGLLCYKGIYDVAPHPSHIESAVSLRVIQHGSLNHLLDSQCIAEIKTRKVGKPRLNNKDWIFSQLWFSNTHSMLFGKHEDRIFMEITVAPEDMSRDLQQWQEKRKDSIEAVANILKNLAQEILWYRELEWKTSSKFALIRWSQDGKGCLRLCRLQDDYSWNVLPPSEQGLAVDA
ncbi:hypothetical protein K469DRAFT_713934 [Zopfia rhizophila CBS 207.26]|uniref:Decapping nuclease n=1 Tax=Zopfia rhizophila CBS 207.26 TaxID=1314779 RepID=A0A6A6DRQ9_9PEZI|nr:hypothetical protein K469DRAFT_713934 [Zopfia rhizophila CBS 207.26]